MKISLSEGIDLFETREVTTVAELGELACQSNISTSVFKNGKRNKANFLYAECIGLDIDNDKPNTPSLSLNEAKKIFSQFKHIILSSKSHNIEKNGIIAERFRVILFTDYLIQKAEDFYATWFWLKEQFPWIDVQCKDPSRFWYQHREVLSVNEQGKTILPIRFSEPEKPTKEGRPVLPGERGNLSKFALEFLEFGVAPGGRNGSVYKVAREFQQSLYEYGEAEERILKSLSRNKVFGSDFSENEATMAIRSAYSTDAKHAPRLVDSKPRAFSYIKIGDLINTPDKQEDWIVENLILRGGVSVVVGMPKIGKSTLVRQLELCHLRGEPFLGRKTAKGSVAHYSFDEKAKTAKRHYSILGLSQSDDMILHFGTAENTNYLAEFAEDVMKYSPTLVVVDTLFDMVDSDDVNNYGVIKKRLSFFNNLAQKTSAHIMFIHHQTKPNLNYGAGSGHSVLGSTAIFGSVDCCLIFEQVKSSDLRTLGVKGRAVDDFGALKLKFDKEKMRYETTNEDPDRPYWM